MMVAAKKPSFSGQGSETSIVSILGRIECRAACRRHFTSEDGDPASWLKGAARAPAFQLVPACAWTPLSCQGFASHGRSRARK